MLDYEKSYFILFSAICNAIEGMETVINQISTEKERDVLKIEIEKLKFAQQEAEEKLLSQ